MEEDKKSTESSSAGKHPDMDAKTAPHTEEEEQLHGNNPSAFNENSTQDAQRSDRNPLKKNNHINPTGSGENI